MDIVECVSEPDRSSLEMSYGLEYVRNNRDMEEFLETWNNFTDTEKKEKNIKSYNNSVAIFCTNDDLTKIIESGIEAPVAENERKKDVCQRYTEDERSGLIVGSEYHKAKKLNESYSESYFRKVIRNSRLLKLKGEINFDEVYKSYGLSQCDYSYAVGIYVGILFIFM